MVACGVMMVSLWYCEGGCVCVSVRVVTCGVVAG